MQQPTFILLEMSEHRGNVLVDCNKIASGFWDSEKSRTSIRFYEDSPTSIVYVKETPSQINELINKARDEQAKR